MCSSIILSWSFNSTVLKEMNSLPRLSTIFIGNWAAACYSCGWFYHAADPNFGGWIQVAADSILRPTWAPAFGHELRLSRVPAAGCKLGLSWVLAAKYKLRLTPSKADTSSSGQIRVTDHSILQLTRVPVAGYWFWPTPSHSWLEFQQLGTSYSWLNSTAD